MSLNIYLMISYTKKKNTRDKKVSFDREPLAILRGKVINSSKFL